MNYLIIIISIIMFICTTSVKSEMWNNYNSYYWGYIFPLTGFLGIAGMIYYRIKMNDLRAFISSSLYIFGMLSGTAFGLYPDLLPSSINPDYSLNVYNSKAGDYGLQIGIYWWLAGIIFAAAYFIFLFYTFRGKIKITENTEGY